MDIKEKLEKERVRLNKLLEQKKELDEKIQKNKTLLINMMP